jgi:oligoribonuclease (3'-5' exoribonuclease)
MVDVETTGNNFERNAIIQIAAVKWDYSTGRVSDDFFDRCLHIHPGREWDPETRGWWAKQGNVLHEIQSRAEDPYTVIRAFYEWLLKDWPVGRREGLQFWAKPISYDFSYIASYFRMFGLENPCHFRYANDVNSFIRGLHGSTDHITYEEELPMEGDAHNALFDVLHQIKVVLHAKKVTTQGVVLP